MILTQNLEKFRKKEQQNCNRVRESVLGIVSTLSKWWLPATVIFMYQVLFMCVLLRVGDGKGKGEKLGRKYYIWF